MPDLDVLRLINPKDHTAKPVALHRHQYQLTDLADHTDTELPPHRVALLLASSPLHREYNG